MEAQENNTIEDQVRERKLISLKFLISVMPEIKEILREGIDDPSRVDKTTANIVAEALRWD